MSKPQLDVKRIYATITVAFAWLLFMALWLFYYATNYNLIQNLGIGLAFLVVAGIIIGVMWVPWAMKQESAC
ncbi:hypothetical protein [Methanobacterium petrolearium]|uniref:hypothetical protein n=1 Tax=Methanobacterium petrolearium TaxID=710190 RepID=UPI001AE2D4D4|nr:hypothetical protein [Methanobacterium petrolearium]MBP1945618.1 glucan phosphoethanolaminetransferase (alkaline phosphatase superfamily) [Methanobacterium petrolearium]BDZ71850.1 hypothetical protein GCM10025861_23670 [Methanobacterium petrolearium]